MSAETIKAISERIKAQREARLKARQPVKAAVKAVKAKTTKKTETIGKLA